MVTFVRWLKALNRWLGWVVVLLILTIALLTVVIRLLLPAVWDYRSNIEQYLSERLHTEVTIGEIDASWGGRFPQLRLQDVTIADHRSQNIGRIELEQLVLGINPVSSLLQWQLVLSKVELWSLHAKSKLVRWPLSIATENEREASTDDSASMTDPMAALWLQPHIFFYDTQIDLTLPSGRQLLLQSEHFNLENSSRQHHFAGELLVTHEQRQALATLRIESDSYQFDPQTTDFDFYLKLAGIDTPLLEAAQELFPLPIGLEQLELNTEIWGNWSEGRLTRILGSLDGGRLQLTTGQALLSELSIQNLTAGFALLQPQRRHFQLQINDFSAQINNQPLSFPQLVINRQLGRFESVALTELNLAEIAHFIDKQSFVPENIRTELTNIAPTGMIRHLLLQWPPSQTLAKVGAETSMSEAGAGAGLDVIDADALAGREVVSAAVSQASLQPSTDPALVDVALAGLEAEYEKVKDSGLATPVNAAIALSEADLGAESDQSQDWLQLTLQADLEEVAFQSAHGAPAMSGISGLLQLQYDAAGLQGRIDLESDRLGLHFPEVFDQGWHFNEAKGVTHFSLAQNILHLSSEYVELHKAGINASGRWSLYLPLEREIQSELTLLIGVQDADGRLAPELIPDYNIDPAIKAWVSQSIKQGVLNQGGFMLHTGTRSIPSRQPPTVQMFMHITNAEVDYQPGWPAVKAADASLLLRDQGLEISVSKGQIYDSQIEHGWVYLPPSSQNLHIIANVNGDSADIGATLLDSPLLGGGNAELKDWTLKGAAQTRLNLMIPLSGGAPEVDVRSAFTGLQLNSKARKLNISQLAGEVSYRHDKGLYAASLSGVLFDQPLTADIVTRGKGAAEKITARLRSSISMSQLQRWSGIEMLTLAKGLQTYIADLDICLQADCSGLTVKSDLKQTALDLIPPFNKAVGQTLPLQLHTDFATPQTLTLSVGDQLGAWLQLDGDQLSRGHLILGAADVRPGAFAGLQVSGQLDQLDYEQLTAMLERAGMFGEAEGAAVSKPLTMPVQVDIGVASLNYDYLQMNNARVLLAHRNAGWDLAVSGTDLNLQANFPDNAAMVPQLQFKTLNLDGLLPSDSDTNQSSLTPGTQSAALDKALGSLQPGSLPDLDIAIAELRMKGKLWGQWSFKVRHRGQNIYIEDIIAQLPDFNARGDIIWRPGDISQSELTLSVDAKDVGRTLKYAGYEKVLQTEKVTANLQLTWPGAPWQYELAHAEGLLTFDARDGRLIEAGRGTGLLRVFGILNMNTLSRRLKLDFADLFAKGVSFDRMKGDYRMVNGVASTKTPFIMRGPSVDMASSGDIDLINETVNQQMAVTLPVTDNIPLAAMLLGAPQVAGLAFLLDKLIGDEVKKEFATVTYTMEGDWSDPTVELLQRPNAKTKAVDPK